jgi:hypothetical protein
MYVGNSPAPQMARPGPFPRNLIGTSVPSRTTRHLELLQLARPLRRFAGSLQADPNASFFLVHQALSRAFAEPLDLRQSKDLESSLRGDIARLSAAHV